MSVSVFKFQTMNNVNDPSDLVQNVKAVRFEVADLVNVDCDNDGGVQVRKALITGLIQQPVDDFMGSRHYWAAGNTVYCDKALDDEIDERFSTVISLDNMITMIRRVDGGMFVGTTNELHFLQGTDPLAGGFNDVWSLPYGVIMGTGIHIRGELVPVGGFAGNCCIFASHRGVIVGGSGGNIANISQDKVSYPHGLTGKACVREENGLVHYLFTTSQDTPAYNVLTQITLDIN